MSTVNSYDACYPIALILNGAILGFLDWDRIRNKKPIQIAILIYALCNINFCLCFTMFDMGLPALEPGSWGWYLWNTLSIITDGIADFGLDIAYILRITALIQNKQWAKFMWCVLIAPIVYLGATCVSLTLLFSSTVPIDPSVSMQIFGAANLLLAIVGLAVHCFLVYLLFTMFSGLAAASNKGKRKISIWKLLAPGITSVAFTTVCICSTVDPSIGYGPIYLFWTFEGLSFLLVNHIVQQHLSTQCRGTTQGKMQDNQESRLSAAGATSEKRKQSPLSELLRSEVTDDQLKR